MKRFALVAAFVLAAAHSPAAAQKVHIDYDPDYDGSGIETFAWTFTPETSLAEKSVFLHSQIVTGVSHYLTQAGVRQVDVDADIQVTYHAGTDAHLRLDTSTWGYGYPAGWYAGGSITTASTYRTGTLVVDVWDTESKTLVWRGIAELGSISNPDAVDSRVDKALAKMVKKWQKIKKKNEKGKGK